MTKRLSGTREWAEATANTHLGCANGCLYCYAKADALRWGRIQKPEDWAKMQPKSESPEVPKRRLVRVMYPSAHDITPDNYQACRDYLMSLLNETAHGVLIVTKPRMSVIEPLLEDLSAHKFRICWRFTIGSACDETLRFWEPEAPMFYERLECLKRAFFSGWQTSISMEPMLDPFPQEVIAKTRPFVTDSIWLGLMRDWRRRISMNCEGNRREAALILAHGLANAWNEFSLRSFYRRWKDDPLLRWKDSIREIVGDES